MEEYISHYENIYKEKDSFKKVVEEKNITISWKDKGYDVLLKYSKYDKNNFVSIISTKPLD